MKQRRIWISIGGWAGLYVCWVVIFQDHALTLTKTLTIQFCYLLFIAANYYAQVGYAIPKLLHRKKYVLFLLFLPAAIGVSAFLRTPLAIWLQVDVFRPGSAAPDVAAVFRDSLLNIFIWVIIAVAVQQVIEKIGVRQYVDRMEKERIKNELDFLKAQFNPHFLFNSINSIYGHIDRQNGKARNMLHRFSQLLRYQLYECNVDSVVIEKEVQYLRNYVALQQDHTEDNLLVTLDISPDIRGFPVAPLLLVTFVENAFKYVSTDEHRPNEVIISLGRKGNILRFRAYNTKDDALQQPRLESSGIGIANARRRLDLQYPGRYELTISDNGDSYEVVLQLQIIPHLKRNHYSK
jgi:two-component system, LytTR family, sensor kinase